MINCLLVAGICQCSSPSNKEGNPILSDPENTHSAPRMRLSDTLLHLGTIPKGLKKRTHVWIYSEGNMALLIRRAFSDCGCTVTDVPRQPLLPGDSARLTIELDTRTLPRGYVRRVVTIVSNAIPNSTTLTLEAIVE